MSIFSPFHDINSLTPYRPLASNACRTAWRDVNSSSFAYLLNFPFHLSVFICLYASMWICLSAVTGMKKRPVFCEKQCGGTMFWLGSGALEHRLPHQTLSKLSTIGELYYDIAGLREKGGGRDREREGGKQQWLKCTSCQILMPVFLLDV